MVGIGINENVNITNETKVNEKGTLELFFKQAGLTTAQMITASLGGNDVDDKSTKLLYFGPNSVTDFAGATKAPAQVLKEIQDFRRHLHDILIVFIPAAILDTEFSARLPLEVTGVQPEQFEKQLTSNETISSISTKIAHKFVELCKFQGVFTSKTTCRVKLLRQKLANTYSAIPQYGAWIESMDVPVAMVKVSDYDRKDYDAVKYPGINKISTQPLPADVVPKEEVTATTSLFEETPDQPVLD